MRARVRAELADAAPGLSGVEVPYSVAEPRVWVAVSAGCARAGAADPAEAAAGRAASSNADSVTPTAMIFRLMGGLLSLPSGDRLRCQSLRRRRCDPSVSLPSHRVSGRGRKRSRGHTSGESALRGPGSSTAASWQLPSAAYANLRVREPPPDQVPSESSRAPGGWPLASALITRRGHG